jgi:predicted small lipoprotein YifL
MKGAYLIISCLLALAALAAAGDTKCMSPPPANVNCPPNTEFQAQLQKGKPVGKTVTGTCVACPPGQYTPAKVSAVAAAVHVAAAVAGLRGA